MDSKNSFSKEIKSIIEGRFFFNMHLHLLAWLFNHLTSNKHIKTLQHSYSTLQQLYVLCRLLYDYFLKKYVVKPDV